MISGSSAAKFGIVNLFFASAAMLALMALAGWFALPRSGATGSPPAPEAPAAA